VRRWGPAVVVVALLLLLSTSAAYAEPTAEDHDRARAALSVGRQKRSEKDHAGALEAFKRAHEIENLSTTGLEVGKTLIDLGRLMEARELLLQIARSPGTAGEPPPITAARTDARQLIDKLEGLIPTLSIRLEGRVTPNVSVTVDGVQVAMETLSEKRRLDPGMHVVRVHHGRAKPSELEVEAKNEFREVTLRIPDDPDAPAGSGGPSQPMFEKFPDTVRQKPDRSYVIAWVFGAVAVVGVGVGATTGLIAANKKSDLDRECQDKVCPPSQHDNLSDAKTLALTSTIAFIVAGVGAGVALWDIFRTPETSPATTNAPTMKPRAWRLDPRGGGLSFKF
jgi:hypothetical protein